MNTGASASAAVSRIKKSARVCGGSARIADTRIPVWLLEAWRRAGTSDEDLLSQYPQLSDADLAGAWQYVAAHREEIEADLRANDDPAV